MPMSEHEKYEQVGRLAEEYSKLKGELNHLNEKAGRAQRAYQLVGSSFPNLVLVGDKMALPPGVLSGRGTTAADLEGILSTSELTHLLLDRRRLDAELASVGGRLRALAPHLV